MIDIYIKKKIGEDEIPEVIKSIHYSYITKSSKFYPENSITLKSNESLCFSIREDPKCPIKGIIDRDKIVLKAKVKYGNKYPTITKEKNKVVEVFDYYPQI